MVPKAPSQKGLYQSVFLSELECYHSLSKYCSKSYQLMNESVSALSGLSRMLEETSRSTVIVSKISEDQSPRVSQSSRKHSKRCASSSSSPPAIINAELLSAIIFLHQRHLHLPGVAVFPPPLFSSSELSNTFSAILPGCSTHWVTFVI